MLPIFLLSIIFGCASAQQMIQCECALFNDQQLNETLSTVPIPLIYESSVNVDSTNCNRDPNLSNDCMTFCQKFYDEYTDVDLCNNTGNVARCIGSSWCETLYNNGIREVTDGAVNLYYRMAQCEDTAFTKWRYGWRDIKDNGLCCFNGEFGHCTFPCGTSCINQNLCECGVFADVQFDKDRLEGANPLPLENIAANFGPPGDFYCYLWPSAEFNHPCDAACVAAAEFYKGNVSLNAPSSRNSQYTYGQLYCQALKARWADLWPENGIGPTSLVAHARMPGCNVDETNSHLRWKRGRTYACHHEQLCCDGDGNRFPCPVLSPL